jgi:hypothetical protein
MTPKFIRVGEYLYRVSYETSRLLSNLADVQKRLRHVSDELQRGAYDKDTARSVIKKHLVPLLEGA